MVIYSEAGQNADCKRWRSRDSRTFRNLIGLEDINIEVWASQSNQRLIGQDSTKKGNNKELSLTLSSSSYFEILANY